MTRKNDKKVARLNHKLLDMIQNGQRVELGMVDRNRYFLTADGRDAILFERDECLLNLDLLMSRYGKAAVYLPIPKARRADFQLIDVYETEKQQPFYFPDGEEL